ncbi:hypothetical protein PoB_004995000 [Plakobranchus ocellatus]|uniref:Uncharacterized protein n=1 Tax=Plakobranchus ocellatus TaxID=259542 RepID=A0AAV4BWG4_9GAST|nr:hypothetical protein PoB_004995000 [Plakobranchus ocellatus]
MKSLSLESTDRRQTKEVLGWCTVSMESWDAALVIISHSLFVFWNTGGGGVLREDHSCIYKSNNRNSNSNSSNYSNNNNNNNNINNHYSNTDRAET